MKNNQRNNIKSKPKNVPFGVRFSPKTLKKSEEIALILNTNRGKILARAAVIGLKELEKEACQVLEAKKVYRILDIEAWLGSAQE